MNNPTFLSSGQIRQWGERTMPLVKQRAYLYSIDLDFEVGRDRVGRVRNQLYVSLQSGGKGSPHPGSTFHVDDEVLVKTVDGVVRDVPSGKIVRSNVWLFSDDAGVGNIEGRMLLLIDVGTFVAIEYTGVVSLRGLILRALTEPKYENADPVSGSAFAAFRGQSDRPKYRWLVENQLFGFGRITVSPRRPNEQKDGRAMLRFSYDLYSMGE